MRAKTLLLAAALSAVTLATVVAQTPVYSVNAVGYVNVTVPAGKFALLANPLNASSNTLSAVLPDAPNQTVVYVYDPAAGYTPITRRVVGGVGSWTGGQGGNTVIAPGKGFFVKAPAGADLNITFVGEVPQGTGANALKVNLVPGYNLVGSIVPQEGKVTTDLKLAAASNDQVVQWDPATQGYVTKTFRVVGGTGQWVGGEPVIKVAEGFFFKAGAASTWTREFSVNQ